MGKELGNNCRSTPRASKPYDVSHSFVRKVAHRVSGYLGSFWTTPEPEQHETAEDVNAESRDDPSDRYNFREFNSTAGSSSSGVPRLPTTLTVANSRLQSTPAEPFTLSENSKRTFDVSNIVGPSGRGTPFRQTEEQLSCQPGPSKMARLDVEGMRRNRGGGDGSDSSETSGCSSLLPQADRLVQSTLPTPASRRKSFTLDEKLTYARQVKRSRATLELNRSIPVSAERLSRTPSFEVSAYGNPIHNKSVKETMITSPFYSGHTTYGGASARRSSLSNSFLNNSANRQTFTVRPANTQSENLNMSHAAKRILAALEEYSSPLNDAKRIPTPSLAAKRRNASQPLSTPRRPPLTVPTTADLLKIRHQQMQDTTSKAREMAIQKDPTPPRRTGKIVTKLKDREKQVVEPAPVPVDLPNDVPLQICSLPKFDINLPIPGVTATSKPKVDVVAPVPPPSTVSSSSSPSFIFSAPAKMTLANSSSTAKVENFLFSPPISVEKWLSDIRSSECAINLPDSRTNIVNDIHGDSTVSKYKGTLKLAEGFGDKFKPAAGSWKCSSCLIPNKAEVNKCVACDSQKDSSSKPDAALNVRYGNMLEPANGSWTSESCMVVQKSTLSSLDSPKDVNRTNMLKPFSGFGATSCDTSKPVPSGLSDTPKSSSGLGNFFKPASTGFGDTSKSASSLKATTSGFGDTKPSSTGFGDTSKPASSGLGNSLKPTTSGFGDTKPSSTGFGDTFKPSSTGFGDASKPASSGFGDQFKAAPGSWSCDSCMVSNNSSASKCVACETAKPGSGDSKKSGFGDQFKAAAGSWNCKECLVNNVETATKCAACDTPNPSKSDTSSNRPAATSQFSFGLPSTPTSSQNSGFGDKFKPAADSWSCKECFVSNSASASKCVACETPKAGSKPDSQSLPAFSFGIPSQNKSGFGDAFKPAAGSWSCPSCLVSNTTSVTKCVACEAAKPGLSVNGPNGPWKCTICLISNKDNAQQCAACDTLRPSAPVLVGSSFNFGLPEGGFKFGIDKADAATVNGPDSTKDKKPSFQFGIPAENKTVVAPITKETAPTPVFSFGIPQAAKPEEPKPAFAMAVSEPINVKDTSTSLPSFGMSAEKPAPFSFAAPVAEKKALFEFGSKRNDFQPSSSAATSSFAPTVTPTPTIAPFGTGLTTNFTATTTATTFGAFPTTTSASTPFAFGVAPTTSVDSQSLPKMPAFGESKPAVAFGAPTTGIFTFGATSTPSPAPTAEPAFSGQTPFATQPTSAPAFPAQTTSAFAVPGTSAGFGAVAAPPAFTPSPATTFGSATPAPFSNPFGTPTPPAYVPPMAVATRFPSNPAPTPTFGATIPGAAAFREPFSTTPTFGAANSTPAFAAPSFSLAVPSTFNFTGGQTPTFNAPPQSSVGPERRRIIHAKRRAQR